MKKDYWLIVAIVVLIGAVAIEWKQVEYVNKKWEIAEGNVKAYSNELSASDKHNTALQLTVEQLKYFNDSILQTLDATRKSLKVKDKNLKSVQYIQSTFIKTDTVVLKDTLFKEPSLSVDTLIGDEWYSVRLGLHYPSMITVKPEFKSEKHIVVSTKKETVNPPKKFFLFRWFQKKHVVLHVDVIEKSPYVKNESSKYVEILK